MRILHFIGVAAAAGSLLVATACSSKVTGTGPGGGSSSSGSSGTSGTTSSSGTSGVSSSGTSGTSGTSGVSSSGTSGTTGVCGFTSDTPGCNTCLISKCCAQARKCNSSAECNALFECIKPCGSSDSCITNCQNRFSVQASDDLAAFFDCISNGCPTQCG